MRIRSLEMREIFATNSEKTIELELKTDKVSVRSSVPIGGSRSKYEVKYFPTQEAINKFLIMRRHVTSENLENQQDVDELLHIIDNTPDFHEIGGNVMLAVSCACLKAFAAQQDEEVFEYIAKENKFKLNMPRPLCNIVGGWKGSGSSDFQEFLFLPVHQDSFHETMNKMTVAYKDVSKKLRIEDPTFSYSKNVESAWTTNLKTEEILDIMTKVANDHLLKLGIDCAASQLWDDNQYYVYNYSGKILSTNQQITYMSELARKFPIIYLEDPLKDDDFNGFSLLTHMLQPRLICGDDLFATSSERLKTGIDFNATSAIIIKPNQVGTVTDAIKTVKLAKENKVAVVVSHRSSDTEDPLIAHFAVGVGADYCKFGISGERLVKINEMLRIEEKVMK
jgi:enolase